MPKLILQQQQLIIIIIIIIIISNHVSAIYITDIIHSSEPISSTQKDKHTTA
jgi:hypothetical protein